MHHVGAILLVVLVFLLLGPLAMSALSAAGSLVEPVQAALLVLNPTRYVAPAALVAMLLLGLTFIVMGKVTGVV